MLLGPEISNFSCPVGTFLKYQTFFFLMKGVEIIKHNPKHEDARGFVSVYVADEKMKEILMLKRKKGSVSGNHYHTGADPTRNPEIQYFVTGKIKLTVKNLDTNEKEEHILTENTEVKINPMIAHKMEMLEDTVFLEFHTEVSSYTDMTKVEL